ncbi:MAG: hypothetical protein KDK70_13835 [Myxococcales bacterium]|nr:hypothetical protein [Myxococcales bacterium]
MRTMLERMRGLTPILLVGSMAIPSTVACGNDCGSDEDATSKKFKDGDRCPLFINSSRGSVTILPEELILRPATESTASGEEGDTDGALVVEGSVDRQDMIVRGELDQAGIPADGYTVMIEVRTPDDLENNPGEHLALAQVEGGGCQQLSDLLLQCRLDANGIGKFAVIPKEPSAHDLSLVASSGDKTTGSATVRVSYGVGEDTARFVINDGQCKGTSAGFGCTLSPLEIPLDDGHGRGFCGPSAPACSELVQSVDGYFRLEDAGASISKPYDIEAVLSLSSSSSEVWFLRSGGPGNVCDLEGNIRSSTFDDVLRRDAFNSDGARICVAGSEESVDFEVDVVLAGGGESDSGTRVGTSAPQLGGVSLTRLGSCEDGEATCYSLDIWTCRGTFSDWLDGAPLETRISISDDTDLVPMGLPEDTGEQRWYSSGDQSDALSHEVIRMVLVDDGVDGTTGGSMAESTEQIHDFSVTIGQKVCTYSM